jgi:hypothetical protein
VNFSTLMVIYMVLTVFNTIMIIILYNDTENLKSNLRKTYDSVNAKIGRYRLYLNRVNKDVKGFRG